MERDFYTDDFEELLKQKTDQYKLYPSDKVWANIYSSLHTRRRRFVIGMSLLVTGILLLAGKEFLMPGNHPTTSIAPKDFSAPVVKYDNSLQNSILAQLKIPSTEELLPNPEQEGSGKENAGTLAPLSMQEEFAGRENLPPVATISIVSPMLIAPAKSQQSEPYLILHPREIPDPLSTGQEVPPVSDPVVSNTEKDNETDANTQARSQKYELKEDQNNLNWLQNSASYPLAKAVKRGKYNWQAYFTPMLSYRTLSGGENYGSPRPSVQNVPIALNQLGSPNDYVYPKPSLGYEAGASLLYRVTRSLTLKAGLQFDYISYLINAYSSNNSQPATIALNTYGYYSGSITAYSNLQNFGGNSHANLYNRYYQLSVPLGFEFKILGNDRLQFNIAADIQPTYLLNRNSYLLTTDYSDYTKAPYLFRQLNFNTGVEAYLSYRMGGLRWQVGPQFRYQLLSTYKSQYPISENIKQYGIKVGVSKTIW